MCSLRELLHSSDNRSLDDFVTVFHPSFSEYRYRQRMIPRRSPISASRLTSFSG
jgi:hypothetical protein